MNSEQNILHHKLGNKNKTTSSTKILVVIAIVFLSAIAILLFGSSDLWFCRRTEVVLSSPMPQNSPQRNEDSRDFFISEYLPGYVEFKDKILTENITRVFPLTIKENEGVKGRGWLVEVKRIPESIPQTYSYYILNQLVEKELENPTSSYYEQGEIPPCKVTDVQSVGNELNLGRNLQEKSGYVILTGNCGGYSSGNFVSVYNIRTVEKIKLTGDIIVPFIGYGGVQGVTETGNALGRLRGIYGMYKPMLVVEYGGFEKASSDVESVTNVGYFDLQTGKLVQQIGFN